MPISRTGFGRTTGTLLAVGFLALLAIGGTSLWLVERTRAYSAHIESARQARIALVGVLDLLQDAQIGQRGYLLTGDDDRLEPYRQAAAALPEQLARLPELLASVPAAALAGPRLEQIVTERMEELARTVELAQAGQTAEVVARVRAGRGQALVDEARGLIDRMIAQIDDSLRATSTALEASGRALLIVAALGFALILLVAAGSIRLAVRQVRELDDARAATEAANTGLEERVQERTAELAAANDEIQRFAYIVSHDLRAPLVNVMGFTSELEIGLSALRDLVDRAEQEAPHLVTEEARLAARDDLPEAVGFIRSSTQRMDRLINAILKLSREGRRALTPEMVKMEEMFQNIASTVQHQLADRGVELRVEAPLPNVISDRLALEQVFGNLVDNAVKYLDPARPGAIVVRGRSEGSRAVYEVEDNGRGIDARDQERIFELFRRAGSQDQPGEGIGLAHVRALVRRLGGSIACSSEPGRGSVFRVSLPRTANAMRREGAP